MTNEEKAILEKCGIHYENDTIEKEIAIRVITETRKQFEEFLKEKRDRYLYEREKYLKTKGLEHNAVVSEIRKDTVNVIINEFFKEK